MSFAEASAERAASHTGRLIAWAAFVAAFAAIGYAGRLAGERPPEDILYSYGAAVFSVAQFAVVLGIVLLISRPYSRELLALRRPTSWKRAAAIGFGVFLAIMVVGSALEPILNPGEEQGLIPDRWRPERAGAFAANFAVVTTVAPAVEELTFRGLGYSLLARYGTMVAIVVSGVAFGLAHGLVAGLPVLVAFGCGLAYLRSRTNSVYPSIILHGAFNAIVLTAAVAVA